MNPPPLRQVPRPLPHQTAAIESTAPVVILVGDPCTGKSFTAGLWLLTLKPGALHGLLAPTFVQAHRGE